LIDSVFYPGNPLHDGAIVIRGARVVAAGCLFPLTENPDISKRLGTRHRAGIGLSEETDALVIVVSEETGKVSVAMKGELQQDLSRDQLERYLRENLGDALQAAVGNTQAAQA
jgi:diadenylate cyclase